jgi:plasmid stability protein
MPTITIRNLDEKVKQRLRVLAAEHGRSMEAEVREILTRDTARYDTYFPDVELICPAQDSRSA